MHDQYFKIFTTLTLSVVLLTGCGGGSNSSPTSSNMVLSPPPPAVASAPFGFMEMSQTVGVAHSSEFSADYMQMPRFFAGGAAAGDIDNDGDIDLFITRGNTQPNLLFINENEQFTDRAMAWGVALTANGTANHKLSGPSFADLDGDGHLDLFIGGLDGDPSRIFQNNGNETFTNVTSGSGLDGMTSHNTISVDFADYDKDGDLDMAMAHWGTPRDRHAPGETETLWRNDTVGDSIHFTPMSTMAGISSELTLNLMGVLGPDHDYTFSPNFSDINADGYPDLLSVADFFGSQVFLNNQDGTFSNVTDSTQITDSNGMGSAVGDYDNDGDFDWFVSSIDGNRLYQNMNGILINVSDATGIGLGGWGWASCFADFDADGDLDIYQTNGWINNNGGNPNLPFTEDKSRLWISDGAGQFSDEAATANMIDDKQGRAVICADFDNDRDIDVLLLINNDQNGAIYWENTLGAKNTLQVSLQGPAPNTQAIGAIITVKTEERSQTREVRIGSNFTSHNPARQFFGLGEATLINDLKINWPDGAQTSMTDIAINQNLTVRHPSLPQ